MPTPAQIQSLLYTGLGKGASYLGATAVVTRPAALAADLSNAPVDGSAGAPVATLLAQFSQNFNYNRSPKYDDVLWTTMIDATLLLVGDLLLCNGLNYFVASLDAMLPPSCVRCTGTVSLLRQASQLDPGGPDAAALPTPGGGHYFGLSRTPVVPGAAGPGEEPLAVNVPACMIANAGRATGNETLPDAAPGPARWRFYVPASMLPKGSVVNRDILVDDTGRRYQVSAAQWTALGYRLECIRLEM